MAIILKPAEEARQSRHDRRRAACAWGVVLAVALAARYGEYTGLIGWWLR